jgi:L,D-transpeptidase catalytic domain/PilZ domain
MADAAADSVPVERRKAARVRTFRHALFTALTGVSRLQEGTVTDISCQGLQIRTRRPTPQGDPVDVEMHGKDGASADTTMMLRGRVARVEDLGGGEYAMGVHLAAKSPRRHAMHPTPVPEAWREAPSTTARFRRTSTASTARPAKRTDSRAARRAAYTALALMALIFLLLCWQTAQPVHGQTTAYPGARVASGINGDSNPLLRRTQDSSPSTRADRSNKGLLSPFIPDGGSEASDVLVATLAPALDDVGGDEPVLAIVVTDLLRPEEWDAMIPQEANGEPELSFAISGDSNQLSGRTQHSLPSTHANRNNKGLPSPFVGSGMGGGLPLASGTVVDHQDEAEAYPVFALVETSRFVLTIYVDGSPARQFPVGLGRDGATPEGLFHIGTKLSDPDWYNRGNVVPAGDPQNPLGKRWLGLSGQGGPTSYGIHPTRDAASIGRPRSRGCVRMRPQDAETLFRLCPVGTPVRICE